MALPLAVALIPVIGELRGTWTRRDSLVALSGLAVFAVIVIGGYVGDWSWTGFRGNTLWDWLHLLPLPLLIPTLVVPALQPRAAAGLAVEESEERASGDRSGDGVGASEMTHASQR